uniref:Uncharacterized protein n=1 Tax=Timema bartmani TaxID=61472 RepID=A0A7R9F7Y5_9NEOP|nr:unnamed protein product [Timema bartmani]
MHDQIFSAHPRERNKIEGILTEDLGQRDVLEDGKQGHHEECRSQRARHVQEGVGGVPHSGHERRRLEGWQAGLHVSCVKK